MLPGQGTFTGTLDAQGKARVVVKIDQLGTYHNHITVASPGGIVRSGTVDVEVLPGPGTCVSPRPAGSPMGCGDGPLGAG